ncbi:MAG: hypothetical protein COV45_00955 [Deltaproteobacteria bacterium CG11_big_fil_rev_8_21_14_0_20_47_16]|nr:MAG: hypothetical protein COV45_00955 [Deltaproteobacteria bacterium CG11_big_fil_rev_8_21_14_0_20_47_16]
MATKKDHINTGWQSLIERRESARIDVNLPVTLRHNGKLIPATAENVSCGGMRLNAATNNVVPGGHVEVVLDLGEMEKDVTLRGTVVRLDAQDQKKVAIQFVNLLSNGHASLQRFLKKQQG